MHFPMNSLFVFSNSTGKYPPWTHKIRCRSAGDGARPPKHASGKTYTLDTNSPRARSCHMTSLAKGLQGRVNWSIKRRTSAGRFARCSMLVRPHPSHRAAGGPSGEDRAQETGPSRNYTSNTGYQSRKREVWGMSSLSSSV